MRSLALPALLFLAAICLSGTPEEGFEAFLDAVYDADAEAFLSCLSQGNRDQLDMLVIMIKLSPEDAAAQISNELGEEITPEELRQWTSLDLVETILSSEQLQSELPDRSRLWVDSCETSGDSSTVYLGIAEVEDRFPVLMVLEGVDWKLAENFLNMDE